MTPSTRRALLPLAVLAAALAGCASRPEIRNAQDAGVDLASYRTYAFFDPLSIVDTRRHALVWQGMAESRPGDDTLANPGPAVDSLVGQIFAAYRPAAPRAN